MILLLQRGLPSEQAAAIEAFYRGCSSTQQQAQMGAYKALPTNQNYDTTSPSAIPNSSSKTTTLSSTSGPLNLSCKPSVQASNPQAHRKEDNNNQLDKLDIEMFNFASKSPSSVGGMPNFPRNALLHGSYERPSSPKSSSSGSHPEDNASLAALEMLRKTKSMLFPSPPASMLAPSGGSAASSPSPHHHHTPTPFRPGGQNNGQHLPDVVSTLPIFSPNHPHFKSSAAGDSLLVGQKHPHLHPGLFGASADQLRFSSLDYSPFRGFPGAPPPHAPPNFPAFGPHLAAADIWESFVP